jgi:hypothetical protein
MFDDFFHVNDAASLRSPDNIGGIITIVYMQIDWHRYARCAKSSFICIKRERMDFYIRMHKGEQHWELTMPSINNRNFIVAIRRIIVVYP